MPSDLTSDRMRPPAAHAGERSPAARLEPGDWLRLPRVPLDRNGPTSPAYAPTDAKWSERPIVEWFRFAVEGCETRVAVDDGLRQLTYRQVWNLVCGLAQMLAAATPAGAAVAILLPNEAFYPVAVLACIAAARPCVVLDRHYPIERNLAIIDDARPAAIILQQSDAEDRRLNPSGLATILVDESIGANEPLLPLPGGGASPDDPAAIIYTSGSTGAPKGVVLSTRGINARERQLIDSVHLGRDDTALPLGSPCTVAGLMHMLAILLAGGRLMKLDLQRIGLGSVLNAIAADGVGLLYGTPALLRALVRLDGAREKLAGLRCLQISGEVLLSADLLLLRRALPRACDIMVVYGATEAPAVCQWYVPRDRSSAVARVPVGYLLPGYDAAIVDAAERPVGAGQVGELVIRGHTLALGEWRSGGLVPGPFRRAAADPTARILATGDLVRLRADGVCVVVGRKDRQVKIRGMRVEPYEIESALRCCADVLDAAVVARRDGEEMTLLAFVVLQPGAAPGAMPALRTQLRNSLPAHMVPARITALPALPLLPGHKVDVEALLARAAESAAAGPLATAPSPAAEHASLGLVARAWSAILEPESLVADTPFDEAGGDSLGLLRLAFELERLSGMAVPLGNLGIHMRPSELAGALDPIFAAARDATPLSPPERRPKDLMTRASPLVLLKTGSGIPPVFIAHGLGGHVGELAELVRHIRSDQPLYGLQAPGLDATPPLDRVEYLAQYFLAAIKEIQPHGPYLLIGVCYGGLVVLELAQRLLESGDEVGLLALLLTYPNQRLWPLPCWLGYLGRTAVHHVAGLALGRPDEPDLTIAHLVRRLARHVRARIGGLGPPRIEPDPTVPSSLQRLREGIDLAERHYRPRFYRGKITYIRPADWGRMPGNPAAIWGRLAQEVETHTVPGDHLSMLTTRAADLGAQLSRCIASAGKTDVPRAAARS